jgi:hypothetical protein
MRSFKISEKNTRWDLVVFEEIRTRELFCEMYEKNKYHILTWRLKAGMVVPEQISIAKQRIRNHVPVTTNNSERAVAR